MIQSETVTINGNEYWHTFSDGYFLIERDGQTYIDAYDPIELANDRVYTETDISIDPTPEDLDEALQLAGRLLLGMDEGGNDDE